MIGASKLSRMLAKCSTLTEADEALKSVIKAKGERWGLWDAWAGRPYDLSGVSDTELGDLRRWLQHGAKAGERVTRWTIGACLFS